MRRSIMIAILSGLFVAGVVEGQTLRRTYSNFRKLEVYAQRVDEIVQRFNDQRAAQLMQNAFIEIEQARRHLFNTEPPAIVQAQLSMLKAKKYIDQAARMVLEKPFGNLKLQLDELINRAEKAVMQVNNDEANYLLNQAKRFRRRAYDAYNSGNPIRAQEYYRISYFFGKKCIDYASAGGMGRDVSNQLIDLEISIQQMIDQGEEILKADPNPYLASQLTEARKYYEEAMEMADRGDTEQAIKRLRLVKRLLYRLYDQAERSGITQDERIADDLYALRVFLESLAENIDITGDPKAAKLFGQANRLYREAEQAHQIGAYKESALKISLSQRMANQLFTLQKKDIASDPENLKVQLQETRRVLKMQEPAVKNASSSSTGQLWQDANQLLDQAESKIVTGQNRVAFQLIQAATRMSVRLQKELKNKTGTNQADDLLKTYSQITDMLDRINQNDNVNENYQDILQQISGFAEMGKNYLDRGELILADEYLKTALQQLKQFTARWRKKVTE